MATNASNVSKKWSELCIIYYRDFEHPTTVFFFTFFFINHWMKPFFLFFTNELSNL